LQAQLTYAVEAMTACLVANLFQMWWSLGISLGGVAYLQDEFCVFVGWAVWPVP